MKQKPGFLKYQRQTPDVRQPAERLKDYREIYQAFGKKETQTQAHRCMDCGVPFCHNGCPLGNIIPEFNEAIHEGKWKDAYRILSSTNNFPEFTGRICPAPCEAACVLGINQDPVTIELIEKQIIEHAFEQGWVEADLPKERSQKKVAVVGSGPAGLAAAAQLNKAGHQVEVYERDDRIGGLLRYGIPDFKLEKSVIDRRVKLMEDAGIVFHTNANVGGNILVTELLAEKDAIVLCGGATIPRDLPVEGRELKGIHFAMDFLKPTNQWVAGDEVDVISAEQKHVVVIGGGDTGADCVGTSNRHGAMDVTQLELLTKPPETRDPSTPWPLWPMQLRTSSSHEEGCERKWAVMTKAFIGNEEGHIKAVRIVEVEWEEGNEQQAPKLVERPNSERDIPCDLALLAIGYIHPQHEGMLAQLEVELSKRGNVAANDYKTNQDKIFVAGDMHRGQSLVVWAISEGREAARAVDAYLRGGDSILEGKDTSLWEV